MTSLRSSVRPRHRSGFTIVEMLIAILVSSVVLISIYQIMFSQMQLFTVQAGGGEVRETLRGATNLLASELMELSNDGTDIYSMTDSSLVVRSSMAAGVVCSHGSASSKRTLGLRRTSGDWQTPMSGDSLLTWDPASNSWNRFAMDSVWTGSAALAKRDRCFWGDSTTSMPRPEVAVRLPTDPGTVTTGSMMRRFRRVEYGLYQNAGRWWLGRRYGAATSWELLTGPLAAPSSGGLEFTYMTEAGAATTDPLQVRRIGILLRAESTGRNSALGGGFISDSIRIEVAVHNVR